MKRLLLCSTEFPPGPGGIGTHAWQLARHLTNMNWQVVVITPQDYAGEPEIAAFNASQPFSIARFRSLPGTPLKALYRYYLASQWTIKWKPDLLLATGDPAVYLGAWLARRRQLPWVAVEHGRIPASWERRVKRWSTSQATAVACVSNYTRRQMLGMGVRPRTCHVIPNGADAERFRLLPSGESDAFRQKSGLPAGNLLITVGNVTERKGQDIVIRALPIIMRQAPETHYLIVGLPTRRQEFTKLAQKLGVAERVHFLGIVDGDTLMGLLNCSDVFVMTSRHTTDQFEGYGIAVVEAALCGTPAVVSANSGLAEAVVGGETGLIVPEQDEAATAGAIVSLLADKSRIHTMGMAGRRRALGEQTWRKTASEYDSFLRSLLHAGSAEPVALSLK